MERDDAVLQMLDEINVRSNKLSDVGPSPRPSLEGGLAASRRESGGTKVTAPQTVKKPGELESLVAVMAGLQFAVVILIAQRRIPEASGVEFFVVLSMLMITAAHGKIIAYLPDPDTILNDFDALKFVIVGVPIFLFMITIEVWFIVFLFSYDAQVELKAFKDNAEAVLTIGKSLSIAKVAMVTSIIVVPRFMARAKQ